MLSNERIADIFDEMADILEFQGANAFRVRAYRNGARTIRDMNESMTTLAAEGMKSLTAIDGIGKTIAEKTITLVETGKLSQHQELLDQVPSSALDMMRIPGLGPKKAAALFQELKIQSLEQLQAACEEGIVRELKGFGKKTEETILKGISIAASASERMLWADADKFVQMMLAHLKECDGIDQLEVAGSYRRKQETIGDLDFLAVSADVEKIMDHFGNFSEIADVIVRGDTKMSIRLHNHLQMDLRVVPAESFGAALQYFTGSKEHNVILRGRAKQQNLKINEYAVYQVEGETETYHAGATEESIYETLGLPWIPPELRQARKEFEWADANALPELITVADIQGDLHMHTTATDGKNSIEEMAQAAIQRGLSYIVITDHSQRVSIANGLNAERLLTHWDKIEEVAKILPESFTLLKGIECDILEDAMMDLPDEVLAQADWVLASIHFGHKQPQEEIMERMKTAMQHPHVHAIAHPTGRLINAREPYAVDMEELIHQAAESGTVLELNASKQRLDLNDVACAAAKAQSVPIVISTDAHSTEGLAQISYGINQARRAGLTKADVLNTRPWTEVKKMISK